LADFEDGGVFSIFRTASSNPSPFVVTRFAFGTNSLYLP